jgi:hypothetical protein
MYQTLKYFFSETLLITFFAIDTITTLTEKKGESFAG